MKKLNVQSFQFLLSLCLSALVAYNAGAQTNVVIGNGVFESCGGAFLDSGGQGGAGYSNNENFTCTICPDTPGDVITVDFITFDLDESGPQNSWDSMTIYDGDNPGEGTLGTYNGTALQGLFVTATPLNTTGCLTFVFQSNGVGTGNFGGTITCETPCDRPVAEATYDAPANNRICVGDVINFDGTPSTAAPGFQIEEWLWDFGDGTTDDSGPIVSHSWDEPGEYIVELYLIDDNGCASTNRISLQVLVATYPSWDPFYGDTNLCLGQELCLEVEPDDYEVTWTGPEVAYENLTNTPLPDNVGECFESEIEVAGFAPGQTLTNINDLQSINIAVEHSWLFDLVITVTCPSGESVILHQQMAEPGGGNVGSNGTDLGIPNTEYYDYSWSNNATQGTWSEVATNETSGTLPEGDYNSLQPLEQLEGCDLNGTWSFQVCDLWGGDDGELSSWGLEFNPAIIPDVTEFTPDIGAGPDSSFWAYDSNGLDVTFESADGNDICVLPTEEGVWPFTYSVTNNHGCQHDSTFTVTVEEAAQADAGPDVTFCGDDVQLLGTLDGVPPELCGNESGNYTYCYGEAENTTWTYCPDNPGDGNTFMTVSFNAGTIENFFDELIIYDGDNTGAPVLGAFEGDLTGVSVTATNATGCLTMAFSSDFSVSCQSGSQTEWDYEVSCGNSGPAFEFEWSPTDGLSDPTSPTPTVESINGETTYTLTAWPMGSPECSSTDEVTVFPAFQFEIDSSDPSCLGNDGAIEVTIDAGTGQAPWDIELLEAGMALESVNTDGGLTVFDNLLPGDYTVIVSDQGGCSYENAITINETPPLVFEVSPADTTICIDGTAQLVAVSDMDDDNSFTYTWDQGVGLGAIVQLSPTQTTTYSVYATDDAGCDSEPIEVVVNVFDSLDVSVTGDELICGGNTATLSVDSYSGGSGEGYEFEWTFNGSSIGAGEELMNTQQQSGTYCVSFSDNCESPVVTACHEVLVEEPIDVQFTADTTRGCLPAAINFTNLIDPEIIDEVLWDFGDGAFSNEFDPAHLYVNPGVYDVSLSITSLIGCEYTGSAQNYITVYNNPDAGFFATPQPTTMPDTEISFEDLSSGSVQEWLWIFDTLQVQGTSVEPNPTFEFPISTGGAYPVTLQVTDANGCTDQITRIIVINDLLNIYVPNAFTPNNDGVNEVFILEGTDIDPTRFTLQVFDRWGEKIFETNDPQGFWNGSVNNGSYYAPDGLYTWRAVVYSLSTAERIELTGTVTLLR